MLNFFGIILINFFDYFHKKKIIKFLKKNNICTKFIFDIGGHKGESVELFCKYLDVDKIISFEPIFDNFNVLVRKSNYLKKKYNIEIINENFACGENKMVKEIFKPINETSSSTLKKINYESKYFKKKDFVLGLKNKVEIIKINQISLNDYVERNLIKKIDFVKIDTEGFELEVLKGLKNSINNISCILFEHHYDDMLNKKYTFRDINQILVKNNFVQVYKLKMYFRNTFEYIYIKK
tara:strand:+ start:306 stop:1016 length:711 start_codon:yes stop_codon:yes gene_type:complete